MEEKIISCHFSENSLRGYCHVKNRIKTIRHKVLRSIETLKKKDWYNPVKVILIGLVLIAAAVIFLDLVLHFISNL